MPGSSRSSGAGRSPRGVDREAGGLLAGSAAPRSLEAELVPDQVHQIGRIAAIEDGERRGSRPIGSACRRSRRHADRMEGADPPTAPASSAPGAWRRSARPAGSSRRRTPGEGEQQDPARIGAAQIRWATRCASVLVLPVPAPAMIRAPPPCAPVFRLIPPPARRLASPMRFPPKTYIKKLITSKEMRHSPTHLPTLPSGFASASPPPSPPLPSSLLVREGGGASPPLPSPSPCAALARERTHPFHGAPMAERIYLYDTTLRDGGQTQGVDFTIADKVAIARLLDQLGVDYVEGGWPGANPTDDGFFADPPPLAPRQAVRVRHDPARRPQRRQRPRPCRRCSRAEPRPSPWSARARPDRSSGARRGAR